MGNEDDSTSMGAWVLPLVVWGDFELPILEWVGVVSGAALVEGASSVSNWGSSISGEEGLLALIGRFPEGVGGSRLFLPVLGGVVDIVNEFLCSEVRVPD